MLFVILVTLLSFHGRGKVNIAMSLSAFPSAHNVLIVLWKYELLACRNTAAVTVTVKSLTQTPQAPVSLTKPVLRLDSLVPVYPDLHNCLHTWCTMGPCPQWSCQSFQIILYMFHPHQCSAPNDLEITVPILGSTQIPFSIVIWFYIGANQAEPVS